MASAEGTDSIELESVFSSKNRDIHSSTLKSTSGIEDGKQISSYSICLCHVFQNQCKISSRQPSLMNSIPNPNGIQWYLQDLHTFNANNWQLISTNSKAAEWC